MGRSNMENAANNPNSQQWQAFLKWRQGLQNPTNTSMAAQIAQGQGQQQGTGGLAGAFGQMGNTGGMGGPKVYGGYSSMGAHDDYLHWLRQRQYGT